MKERGVCAPERMKTMHKIDMKQLLEEQIANEIRFNKMLRNCIDSESKLIQIKYHSQEIEKLRYIDGKSDWIDLRAAERKHLHVGDFALINLGVSMKIPNGYEAIIAPRSSTFKRYGLIQANGIGIIDNSFSGDDDVWMMPVYATREVTININDRICQFRIQKNQPSVIFQEVDHLDTPTRGGFGSTGVA